MKRPHILFAEADIDPGRRQPFPVGTDFYAPRDMEVEAFWFGSRLSRGGVFVGNEVNLALNWNVKTRSPVIQRQPFPVRLFQTTEQDIVLAEAQLGWRWRLKYPYRLKKDSGFVVEAQNTIPFALPVVSDIFTVGFHGAEVLVRPDGSEFDGEQRMLAVEDNVPRQMGAPRSMASPSGAHRCDGRLDLNIHDMVAMRGSLYVPEDPAGSIYDPRSFYVRVSPIGREKWSEVMVPLAAYGMDAIPAQLAGVHYRPPSRLVIPRGQAVEFDVENRDAAQSKVQIAILGYVEED